MKNEIKQHRIDNIMNLDCGRYFDCMNAVVRLMDGFDIHFLSGNCGDCHGCEDDFEDCK
jgi:hypothetical protein